VISTQVGPGEPQGDAARAETGARGLAAGGWRGTRVALLVALAGGGLLAAAFPPLGIWPLAFVGPALLLLALHRRGLRASFGVGLVFGVAFYIPLFSWVINVAWYAWLALALSEAVIFGVLAIGQRLLLDWPRWAWPPAVAGWWVAAEALRDRWPWGGFPWGRLVMSQSSSPSAGWAAFGGTPWVTFLVALTAGCLAVVLLNQPWRRSSWWRAAGGRRARSVASLGALVIAAAVTFSGAALRGAFVPSAAGDPTAEVAAIQGDVPRGTSLATQLNDTDVTQNHAAATITLAREVAAGKAKAPDVVIWPENSTSIDPSLDAQIYQAIMGAVDTIGKPVLVGAVLENPLRNAGQLWLPEKGPVAIYVKRQLVPFGEYIPLRGLISKFSSLTQLQPENFTPGHKNVVFHIGKIRLGVAICYEIGFDGLVRSDVTDGANLLTVQTNDATFERDGQTGETYQQLDMARIRAIESDRAVIVASTTGASAIIAPSGQLITASGLWRRAILESQVPLITYRTLADVAGAWPETIIAVLTVAGLGVAVVKRSARAVQSRRLS
jgi:apolipoprotein N-acyltransferase